MILNFIKRYRFFLASMAGLALMLIINNQAGIKALNITAYSLKEMIFVIPPIFILLGLLDEWVPKETMVKFMGKNSGIRGAVTAFILGSAAAGPLYGAFPVAAVFMKKGAGFFNVMIFIGAWSTTKIPMFLFELSALGVNFALTRLAVSICGIIIIASIVNRIIKQEEIDYLYLASENITM